MGQLKQLVDGVDLELLDYILNEIKPMYKKHDLAHNVDHFDEVLIKGLKVAKEFKYEDLNKVAAACALHDVGIGMGAREDHHINSYKAVKGIKIKSRLRKWFNDDEIEEIAKACLNHRASAKKAPDDMLSKIVCTADRHIDLSHYIMRCIIFHNKVDGGKATYENIYNDTYEHMKEKMGYGGYMKLVLNYGDDVKNFDNIKKVIADEDKFKVLFDKEYKKYNSKSNRLK